jgi:hypothetical protein
MSFRSSSGQPGTSLSFGQR